MRFLNFHQQLQVRKSLPHYPPPLIPRQLAMDAIILLWILNRRHAMNSRRAFEMNPFIRMPRRTWMFLENTPGGAVIRVRVAWLK